ncbi:MAG TPA: type III pantothenate kinase [Rhodanobacteraceae bacterium]|nr:type III pantothenate kinase [Rhodanobacteraceae bacterium]
MRLLLDLGNTRLKWALHAAGEFDHAGALTWDTPGFDAALAAAWRDLPAIESAWAATVTDVARRAAVTAAIAARWERTPRWAVASAAACGVRNAYDDPAQLGVDRWLSLIAARVANDAPCVIAGCGTALTLDALAGDGQHLGGLIAPGPVLMRHALDATAPVLREAGAGCVVEVATRTADALTGGTWQATAALVERFSARMAPRLGGTPRLLLAGGDAAQVATLLEMPARVIADLVLRGLAAYADAPPADGARG